MRLGLTAYDLAARANLGMRTINDVEAGTVHTTLETVLAMAHGPG